MATTAPLPPPPRPSLLKRAPYCVGPDRWLAEHVCVDPHRTRGLKTFGAALHELLVEHDYVTRSGRTNWALFAAELQGLHYDTLRKAVAGDRRPSPALLEECARVLRVRPEYFLEYRLYLAQRAFDADAIGLERATKNLVTWAEASRQRRE